MTTPAHDGPLHDAHAPPRSNRAAAAANGLSTVALLSAVLASVVGAVLTAELGTSQLGRLGGATLGPVISTTITTWWSGGRGRLQLVAITVMTLLALGITVSGFLVADTVAEKPVLGDDGSGSLVPSGVAPAAAPDPVDPLDPGDVTGPRDRRPASRPLAVLAGGHGWCCCHRDQQRRRRRRALRHPRERRGPLQDRRAAGRCRDGSAGGPVPGSGAHRAGRHAGAPARRTGRRRRVRQHQTVPVTCTP